LQLWFVLLSFKGGSTHEPMDRDRDGGLCCCPDLDGATQQGGRPSEVVAVSATTVLYPPIILVFIALGVAAMFTSLPK
jgi:hypothetical protein